MSDSTQQAAWVAAYEARRAGATAADLRAAIQAWHAARTGARRT